jgi:hypothetical protein
MSQPSDDQIYDRLERDDATKDVCRKIVGVMRFVSTPEVRALVLYVQRQHHTACREDFHRLHGRGVPFMSFEEFRDKHFTVGQLSELSSTRNVAEQRPTMGGQHAKP